MGAGEKEEAVKPTGLLSPLLASPGEGDWREWAGGRQGTAPLVLQGGIWCWPETQAFGILGALPLLSDTKGRETTRKRAEAKSGSYEAAERENTPQLSWGASGKIQHNGRADCRCKEDTGGGDREASQGNGIAGAFRANTFLNPLLFRLKTGNDLLQACREFSDTASRHGKAGECAPPRWSLKGGGGDTGVPATH